MTNNWLGTAEIYFSGEFNYENCIEVGLRLKTGWFTVLCVGRFRFILVPLSSETIKAISDLFGTSRRKIWWKNIPTTVKFWMLVLLLPPDCFKNVFLFIKLYQEDSNWDITYVGILPILHFVRKIMKRNHWYKFGSVYVRNTNVNLILSSLSN